MKHVLSGVTVIVSTAAILWFPGCESPFDASTDIGSDILNSIDSAYTDFDRNFSRLSIALPVVGVQSVRDTSERRGDVHAGEERVFIGDSPDGRMRSVGYFEFVFDTNSFGGQFQLFRNKYRPSSDIDGNIISAFIALHTDDARITADPAVWEGVTIKLYDGLKPVNGAYPYQRVPTDTGNVVDGAGYTAVPFLPEAGPEGLPAEYLDKVTVVASLDETRITALENALESLLESVNQITAINTEIGVVHEDLAQNRQKLVEFHSLYSEEHAALEDASTGNEELAAVRTTTFELSQAAVTLAALDTTADMDSVDALVEAVERCNSREEEFLATAQLTPGVMDIFSRYNAWSDSLLIYTGHTAAGLHTLDSLDGARRLFQRQQIAFVAMSGGGLAACSDHVSGLRPLLGFEFQSRLQGSAQSDTLFLGCTYSDYTVFEVPDSIPALNAAPLTTWESDRRLRYRIDLTPLWDAFDSVDATLLMSSHMRITATRREGITPDSVWDLKVNYAMGAEGDADFVQALEEGRTVTSDNVVYDLPVEKYLSDLINQGRPQNGIFELFLYSPSYRWGSVQWQVPAALECQTVFYHSSRDMQ